MNAILIILALALSLGVSFLIPASGPSALVVCAPLAVLTVLIINQGGGRNKNFLLQVFAAALLVRLAVGTAIFYLGFQDFFGGDALTYDELGNLMSLAWAGGMNHISYEEMLGPFLNRNWGMIYVVAAIYSLVGRNMLAVQYFNAVLGAATAPVIFLCAQHIFSNLRVSRLAALSVAFYPSLVLWSSQGLKDGPIVFLLALIMLATFKLGERMSIKHFALLAPALFALLTLRFYIFYMAMAAVVGAFVIGMRPHSTKSLVRQFILIVSIGLVLTYLGVLRTASGQLEAYADLERIQVSRADLSKSQSGFGRDVDVSTTSGALTVIPVGMVYLLFAPFPWQLANLRQLITLPEMLAWWAAFPALVLGGWFTVKFRLRQALPILIFTVMLTLAYSVFQGNVGTAYRQRSQILVFYFIFVAVGAVLVKEKQESREQQLLLARQAGQRAARDRRSHPQLLPPRARAKPPGEEVARGGGAATPGGPG